MRCLFTILFIFFFLSNDGQISLAADKLFQTPADGKFLKTTFTTKEGLPQNTPTSIVQTRDGYLWLATFGGLARFDGVKFTVFTTSNTPALVNNRWTALYEDAQGVLWIGSEDGDLMNYQNGEFKLIKKSEGFPNDSTILSIYLNENNILWLGNIGGVKTYDLKTRQFQTFGSEKLLKNLSGLSGHLRVLDFTKDKENNLWLASNHGLIRFRDGQFTNFDTTDALPDNVIISVKTDFHGNLWVLGRKNLGIYQPGNYKSIYKSPETNNITPLAINNRDQLFFVIDQKLFEVDDQHLQIYDSLIDSGTSLNSLTIDNQDNIWVGTTDMLVQLRKRRIQVYGFYEDGKMYPVSSIVEDADKSVWSASLNRLIRFHDHKFDITEIPVKGESGNISSLGIDGKNALWIGRIGGISKLFDNKFTEFNEKLIFGDNISALFFDRKNNLWIGSHTDGLQKYADGVLDTYTTREGLVNNSVVRIFEDSRGVIWIGTRGGLSRFENGGFTNFTVENGLTSNSIRDIYEDVDGTVWIGTYGGGLMRYRDRKFTAITSQNGLAEDIVSRILVDDDDNFWMMGNQGIFTVDRASLNNFADGRIKNIFCTVYNENDGMEIGEGNGGNQTSGWKASDGKLWFPMIRGGIIIDPSEAAGQSPPPVYIENAFLNKQKIEAKDKLEIDPGQFNLEINYTAVSFSKPEQIHFRYKLENYDEDWQDVGTRRVAYYPNLPPGNYLFKVAATSGKNIWSIDDAQIEITVHAPFWRTQWFYALVFLSIIALIIAAYQFRVQRLENSKLRQREFFRQLINAHETERFRIAAELHDSLGQELLIIKNWALLGLSKLKQKDDATKQLEVISETASHALQETRNISHNLRPNHLQRFGLTETLENMVYQIAESSNIEFQNKIENIDNLFNSESELSIYRIVQESLTNIVKHSGATGAAVIISNLGDQIKILITDNGGGFDIQSYKHFKKGYMSFGLDNIIQRSEILGGKYSIHSNGEKGTEISISLPVIKHYDEA